MKELKIADGKYTLVFGEPNDRLVAVQRYGEEWIREEECFPVPNWVTSAIYELKNAHEKLNTPEVEDFIAGAVSEAQHQRNRYGQEHDGNKTPLDWFWLIGYLAQKAAAAAMSGDVEKAKHHTISTTAVLANWHAQLTNQSAAKS